eukprot:COSAG03_NODE_5121_length_1336_cov_1053.059014_2_plen_282_part_00
MAGRMAQVNGLNVTNANPVLVQLRISNNKRNLQIQLAPESGLNLTVAWTKQAYAANASGCDSACVQSTLTTNKCGVAHPLIQPLGILGAATKVVSDTTLNQNGSRPTFLWTDGFQTAFTDEHGESKALAASGVGAGFVSTITTPPSKFGTVIRVFVGVRGTTGQLTATLHGAAAAHYNETFASNGGAAAKFGVAVLQVPASASAVQVSWTAVGPSANGSVLLGAIAVQAESSKPASALRATQRETERAEAERQTPTPARKCAAPPATGHAGTIMLQAAALM